MTFSRFAPKSAAAAAASTPAPAESPSVEIEVTKNASWKVGDRQFLLEQVGENGRLTIGSGDDKQELDATPQEWIELAKAVRKLFGPIDSLATVTVDSEPAQLNFHKPWTPELDEKLKKQWTDGVEIQAIADDHQRTVRAIEARLVKLEVIATRRDAHGPRLLTQA